MPGSSNEQACFHDTYPRWATTAPKYIESTIHRKDPRFTSGDAITCTVMPRSDAVQQSANAAENTNGNGSYSAAAIATSDERANSDNRVSGAYTSIAPTMNSGVPVGKLFKTMQAAI